MCKGSLLVRITFSFFFSSLLCLSLPVHFYSSFVVHVKIALELLKYIHTQREEEQCKQSSLSLFFHSFSRNSSLVYIHTHIYIYACARSMNGYNITYIHIHHQEKRSKVETRTKNLL